MRSDANPPPGSEDVAEAIARAVLAHLQADVAESSKSPPVGLKVLVDRWRTRLASLLKRCCSFEEFQRTSRSLVILAARVHAHTDAATGTAIASALEGLCASLVERAENLGRAKTEAAALRLTGRSVDRTLSQDRTKAAAATPLHEMAAFQRRA